MTDPKSVQKPDKGEKYYEVLGAGNLRFNLGALSRCSKVGISVGAEWGCYGYIGGVMSISEVRRLVKDLSKWLKIKANKKEVARFNNLSGSWKG